MIAKVDAKIPKAVLIKASEIPVANADVSGVPCDIAANARIIPNTVPIKPINVAIILLLVFSPTQSVGAINIPLSFITLLSSCIDFSGS